MRTLATLFIILMSATYASAQCPQCGKFHAPYDSFNKAYSTGNDALQEVNARRARAGKRPFIFDAQLTIGAERCAQFRARRLIKGHTSNDFSFLPPGAHAVSAGCAAWPQGAGWGSCCSEDNYTYAGAAWAIGPDGNRYMHLFVR